MLRYVLQSCKVDIKFSHHECITEKQFTKIVICSNERQDKLHEKLEKNLDYSYHLNCYSDYTSNQKIESYLKKKRKLESADVNAKATSSFSPKRLMKGVFHLCQTLLD